MFNLKEFVLNNLIGGVKRNSFSKEYASILATNYLLRGILTEADVQKFDEETTVEEVKEIEPIEEPAEELAEEEIAENTDIN